MRTPRPRIRLKLAALAGAACLPAAATAQPTDFDIPAANASPADYPPGVTVRRGAHGPVYVDRKGRTLYGLDVRTLAGETGTPYQYCASGCTDWQPLLAPKDAVADIDGTAGIPQMPQGAPPPKDWSIVVGPEGPQWAYKRVHLVFTRRGEKKLSDAFDGTQNFRWNSLKFAPAKPEVVAPPGVTVRYNKQSWDYNLVDPQGRLLFQSEGACGEACAQWLPYAAAMAAGARGDWTVLNSGDRPQWAWRGAPVFVLAGRPDDGAPEGGRLITAGAPLPTDSKRQNRR